MDQTRAGEGDGKGLLAIRVTTRAARDEIAGLREGVLQVRTSAPPAEGRANAAVCRLIARRLRVPQRDVTLVRGERSREKLLLITGIDGEEALRLLLAG